MRLDEPVADTVVRTGAELSPKPTESRARTGTEEEDPGSAAARWSVNALGSLSMFLWDLMDPANNEPHDRAFTLKGTVVRLSRCHCDEDVACGPCVDAHWLADSAEPGAYVLVQGTYPDAWQLGSIVQVKLKAYQWESPPLPVASTS